jgi:hypothetical protein
MSKYVNLGEYLRRQKNELVRMTFAEVERVIGHKLPSSSRYPAWWSNNPSNNVMTKVWLQAGFKTEQVDMQGRKLVFRRVRSNEPGPEKKPATKRPAPSGLFHPAFGSMKGLIQLAPGVDLTEPADPDWGKVYDQ